MYRSVGQCPTLLYTLKLRLRLKRMSTDTFGNVDTEPFAQDVDNENEASAEDGSANSTQALETETEVKV